MKYVKSFLILATFCLSFYSKIYSQENQISNIVFTVDSVKIEISYDLSGEVDDYYTVEAVMKNKNEAGSEYKVYTAEGDFGNGKFAGYNKKIIWYYPQDITVIPNENDFYFEVTASSLSTENTQNKRESKTPGKEKSSGGSTWYYYVGGAVVVIVVLALTVFSSKEEEDNSDNIPTPPTRP